MYILNNAVKYLVFILHLYYGDTYYIMHANPSELYSAMYTSVTTATEHLPYTLYKGVV